MSYIGADLVHNRPLFKFRCRAMAGRNFCGKKNLFNDWEEESESPSEDAIKVFLRVKPSKNCNENVIKILDQRTVTFKMPPELTQNRRKLNMPDEFKYTFTNIFQPDVTQGEIFTGCVAPLIKDLFAGQHCLLFTYGTTNAGKTFTVLGTGDKPGILPRCVTTVFKTIRGKEYKNARIRPHLFNSALEVTDTVLTEESSFKQNILTWSHEKSMQSDSSRLCKTNATACTSTDEIIGESVFREMQRRLTNDTSIVEHEAEPEDRFSVWVSFAEIYNEAVFDLLQPVTLGGKRKQLKLAQDDSRNMYIKGLKHIFVQSEEEAYKVLMFGKNNLQVGATRMNSSSSRSHCIFTLKLMRCPNVECPERVTVSSISVCDLAGAERQKKTLNAGLRLKESQNINSSLHTLSRCFTTIRENQLNNENKLIPFRDSKLTHLFQHALQGKEAVTMIVNVNPEPHLCEETQHVLKASAIAKHIVVQPRMVQRPNRVTRTSVFFDIVNRHNRSTQIRWDSCVKPKAPNMQSLTLVEVSEIAAKEPTEREQKQDTYENLLILVESLKEKLKEEKTKHHQTKKTLKTREDEIRKEMKDELQQLLDEAKEQNELDNKRARDAGITEERIISGDYKKPAKRIKRKVEENDSLDLADECDELTKEVRMQEKEIEGLKDLVNMMKDEKKELTMELTSARLQLGWKDKEIENLKAKIEMFGDENELKKGYLALEKDMECKLQIRDNLLDEARSDLLEEVRMKEEAEEELEKLEKEIAEKDAEIANLQSDVEDLYQEVKSKNNALEMMENHIEGAESAYDEEVRALERRCTKLEEQLAEKERELAKLTDGDTDLKQQLELETEKILCEKVVLEELLQKQKSDFKKYKEEMETKFGSLVNDQEEERLRMLLEFEANLSEKVSDMRSKYDKAIEALNDEITGLREELAAASQRVEETEDEIKSEMRDRYDANMVEMIIKTAEEHGATIENLKKEFSIEKAELEKKVFDLIDRLENESKARDCITEELESAKKNTQELSQSLMERSGKIEELGKKIEFMQQDKARLDRKHSSEVSILEQSLKQQIQENAQLTLQMEKLKNYEKLQTEVSKLRAMIDDLKQALRNKDRDLDCSQSEMAGYNKLVPLLKAELEQKRMENADCKRRCEDKEAIIFNMEQETISFQANQKEIIGKYEDQLKRAKDENETLKKEVARLTTTFYKSTPTPKKDLEKQIEHLKKETEDLRRQLEDVKINNHKLREENDTLRHDPLKENHNLLEAGERKHKSQSHVRGRPTTVRLQLEEPRSRERDTSASSEPANLRAGRQKCSSASKVGSRRTRATNVPSIEVLDFDKDGKQRENPQKQTRKKLWNASSQDDIQFDDNIELDMTVPQESPGTVVRRTLRSRNK